MNVSEKKKIGKHVTHKIMVECSALKFKNRLKHFVAPDNQPKKHIQACEE